MTMAIVIILLGAWFYIGGALFVAAPAFMVSEINLQISWAKKEGRSALRFYAERAAIFIVCPTVYIGGYWAILHYLG